MIDSGIGISEQDQGKLFKLFGFLEDSADRNTSGIGLGLVISDKITSNFGGKITFKSELGKGSSFIYTFKLDNSIEDSNS